MANCAIGMLLEGSDELLAGPFGKGVEQTTLRGDLAPTLYSFCVSMPGLGAGIKHVVVNRAARELLKALKGSLSSMHDPSGQAVVPL